MSEVPQQASAEAGEGSELLKVASGLARVAALSWWHVAGWTASAAVAGTSYIAKKAADGEPAATIFTDAVRDLRGMARQALGIPGHPGDGTVTARARTLSREDLVRDATTLVSRASDVTDPARVHPAFARVIDEITPDEARILVLLARDGSQPAVEVRTRRGLGRNSELVEGGLTMIAEQAGCLDAGRDRLYLSNLTRLGVTEFRDEAVGDPQRYQVVEAQPRVTAALARAGRMPRTVRRSVALTDFGAEFCRTCLPQPHAERPS